MRFHLDHDRLEVLPKLDREVEFLLELGGLDYESGDPLTARSSPGILTAKTGRN